MLVGRANARAEDYMIIEPKIKISDNHELRKKLNEQFDLCDQVMVAKWALNLSRHIFEVAKIANIGAIENGFHVNEEWQIGKCRMYDVRQAGFEVHKIAKETKSEIEQTCLRVAGQAIATGHMKEHGLVASDYAIKLINLMWPNNIKKVEEERNWQITILNGVYEEIEQAINRENYASIVLKDNCRLHINMNSKSQTLMYLSINQRVREFGINSSGLNELNWAHIETKTGKIGYCLRDNLGTIK
jgi:hypothetical protein